MLKKSRVDSKGIACSPLPKRFSRILLDNKATNTLQRSEEREVHADSRRKNLILFCFVLQQGIELFSNLLKTGAHGDGP